MYAPSSSNPLTRTALEPPVRFIPPPSFTDHPVIKQEEPATTEPILIDSRSQTPEPRSSADSRDQLFAALEIGDYALRKPRPIATADDLDDVELGRCFDILHACSLATDSNATRAATRDTMECFLNAVFRGWTSDSGEPPKPGMDFVVREHISVGNICSQPANHHSSASCAAISACHTPIFGIATYRSRPAQLSISFSTEEPPQTSNEELQDLFCPMERADVRWEAGDWMAELRRGMKMACMAKVHKFNKHLAIWYVRRLIEGWAKGSICIGKDVEVYSFVSKDAVEAAFAMMGDA